MGWSYHYNADTKAKIVAYLLGERLGERYTVLDKATVGNHLWTVTEDKTNGDKFIHVDLLSYSRTDACWGYKTISESAGPSACDCPLRFLDLVPEPERNYGWREHVRAYHEADAAARARRKALAPGVTVTLYGMDYRLDKNIGRKGWHATRVTDGMPFRIKANQMKDAACSA